MTADNLTAFLDRIDDAVERLDEAADLLDDSSVVCAPCGRKTYLKFGEAKAKRRLAEMIDSLTRVANAISNAHKGEAGAYEDRHEAEQP